jgi:uncharacterized protein
MSLLTPMFRGLDALIARLLIAGVWVYRGSLGLFWGGHCRHQPTCSQYMIDAVRKHGPWLGGWRGLRRVLRCHPFGSWGYDPA